MMGRARTFGALLRWLGPWAHGPIRSGVTFQRVSVDGRFPAKLYLPAGAARGALAIAPGLHPDGPDDPRMDRFCRALAASGIVALAPYLPDYVALTVRASAIDDFARAFDALRAHPRCPVARPGVFSISFGSLPALRLAAARSRDLGGLVVFGGYADWAETIRFAASGQGDRRNQPVVLMNLVDDVPPPVTAAWRRYIDATWGKPEVDWAAAARRLADDVPPAARDLYLVGVGLAPGVHALIDRGLAGRDLSFVDPRPHLGAIRCPTWIVHGRTDDVIPVAQAEALARALPHAQLLLTGLYGHTAAEKGGAAAREAVAMLRIAAAVADAATRGDRGA